MTEDLKFSGLPTEADQTQTVFVDWSLMAAESQTRALATLRTLPPELVGAAMNHMLMFYRQQGSQLSDWALAYTDMDFRQGGAGELLYSLTYLRRPISAQLVELVDSYVVSEMEIDTVTEVPLVVDGEDVPLDPWLMDVVVLDQSNSIDEPARIAPSEVTAHNNSVLSRLEQWIASYYSLEDNPDAELNPVMQVILATLTYLMQGEFLASFPSATGPGQVELRLRHNAAPAGMDVYIDLKAIGDQFTKMLAERP